MDVQDKIDKIEKKKEDELKRLKDYYNDKMKKKIEK